MVFQLHHSNTYALHVAARCCMLHAAMLGAVPCCQVLWGMNSVQADAHVGGIAGRGGPNATPRQTAYTQLLKHSP